MESTYVLDTLLQRGEEVAGVDGSSSASAWLRELLLLLRGLTVLLLLAVLLLTLLAILALSLLTLLAVSLAELRLALTLLALLTILALAVRGLTVGRGLAILLTLALLTLSGLAILLTLALGLLTVLSLRGGRSWWRSEGSLAGPEVGRSAIAPVYSHGRWEHPWGVSRSVR